MRGDIDVCGDRRNDSVNGGQRVASQLNVCYRVEVVNQTLVRGEGLYGTAFDERKRIRRSGTSQA